MDLCVQLLFVPESLGYPFSNNNSMFGEKSSEPAMKAAELFKEKGKTKIIELGAGQGRDSLFIAKNGFEVYSLDYSKEGIESIKQKAQENELSECLTALQYDVRKNLLFEDGTFDACHSYMLYCIALTTSEHIFQER